MQRAIVIGTARATAKHASMLGQRLLIVQPVGVNDSHDGPPLIAVDQLGATRGDRVMLTSDGSLAAKLLSSKTSPVRWITIGIVDSK